MRSDIKKARGRPPAYDRDRALKAIRDTFWRAGFAATSLDELAAATGMKRPSLYGAFGDKRAMYLAAMAAFSADVGRRLAEALTAPALADALARFYAVLIEVHLEEARGCFVSGTAPVEAVQDPAIREALSASFAQLDALVAARLRRAQADGELSADAEVAALAKVATAVVHSLALRARAGAQRGQLETIAAQARRLICGA